MNLTAQHLFYYKDGKLLIESDFVSGNKSKGWATPDGAYELTYKQLNAVLKGKNYNTPVTYWMPFNGNIGMHDGYWRSTFGGTIYKNNGSHGCVNLPPKVAKTIYENITAGTPVLCYYLSGTETEKNTRKEKPKTKAAPVPSTEAPTATEVSPTVPSVKITPEESLTPEDPSIPSDSTLSDETDLSDRESDTQAAESFSEETIPQNPESAAGPALEQSPSPAAVSEPE